MELSRLPPCRISFLTNKQQPPGISRRGPACQKSLAEFAARRRQRNKIIFSRDMCVRENTARAASVEFVRHRRTNYARSRPQAFCRKNPEGFSTVSPPSGIKPEGGIILISTDSIPAAGPLTDTATSGASPRHPGCSHSSAAAVCPRSPCLHAPGTDRWTAPAPGTHRRAP